MEHKLLWFKAQQKQAEPTRQIDSQKARMELSISSNLHSWLVSTRMVRCDCHVRSPPMQPTNASNT